MKKPGRKITKILTIAGVFLLIIILAFLVFRHSLGQIWKIYNYEDSLTIKLPYKWTVLKDAKTDIKYPYDEEYLFSITDVTFEALKTDKAQIVASVHISRMPKASVPGGMETLVSLMESRTVQYKRFPRQYLKINNWPTIKYDIISRKDKEKTSHYWIDTGNYIYFIEGRVSDNPLLTKLYYELLVTRIVNSLKFPK